MDEGDNKVSLYALVALGQVPGSIAFYGEGGWVGLWADPYRLLFGVGYENSVPYYWNLYCIGYDLVLEPNDRQRLEKNGHITMTKRAFAEKYGYSYYGGRDMIAVGKVGKFRAVMFDGD